MQSTKQGARHERRGFTPTFKAEAMRRLAERRTAGAGETLEQENRRLRRRVATLQKEQAFVNKWRRTDGTPQRDAFAKLALMAGGAQPTQPAVTAAPAPPLLPSRSQSSAARMAEIPSP